MIQNNEDIFV